MVDIAAWSGSSPDLIVVGLGPGDFDRIPAPHRDILLDLGRHLVVRTIEHPAARQLADRRAVEFCDDLYEASTVFDDVYDAIVSRVSERLQSGPTAYVVPGSPNLGEFAVRRLVDRLPGVSVLPGESFVDYVLANVGYDPFERGLRILNGHDLPFPLVVDCPTIVGHLDAPVVLADVAANLARVLPPGAHVTVVCNGGASDERIFAGPLERIPSDLAGFRTSMFVDVEPGGLVGAVRISRRLREECPWDREQTHQSLVSYLMEESAELAEAIADLPDDSGDVDFVAYDSVEDELGDVLLQVLFHAAIADERGAFDIDDLSNRLRDKLVRRHPHVFGDIEVSNADDVVANWSAIKATERGDDADASLLDGIPIGMAVLERAVKVQRRAARAGFDWADARDILPILDQEREELAQAMAGKGDVAHELGDLLFTTVNLIRKLDLSAEVVMRSAVRRFEDRFRHMESAGPVSGLSGDELERRWNLAKESLK